MLLVQTVAFHQRWMVERRGVVHVLRSILVNFSQGSAHIPEFIPRSLPIFELELFMGVELVANVH